MRPEVVTVAGIARMLSVSQRRADQLSRSKGFPEPLPTEDRVRVWRKIDVEYWIRDRDQ